MRADAIIVPGVGNDPNIFRFRVDKGISLYKEGEAPKIIFTGRCWGNLKPKPKWTEAGLMAEYAERKGVPRRDILLEKRSLNTIGNFYLTKKYILEPRKMRRVILVTEKFNYFKVRYIAEKVLGPKYKLEIICGDMAKSLPRLSRSHTTLPQFKRYFRGLEDIQDGDTAALGRYLKTTSFYRSYRNM